MATCSPSDLVEAGKEFLGLNGVQREAVIAALLCKILQKNSPMAHCDAASLMEDAKCFACRTPNQIQVIQTQLLCEILHGGGGGGGETCIVCLEADAAPVDDGPCDCSIAYNLNGRFWFWNVLTNAWIPFIT
jgi:hypothetical protein